MIRPWVTFLLYVLARRTDGLMFLTIIFSPYLRKIGVPIWDYLHEPIEIYTKTLPYKELLVWRESRLQHQDAGEISNGSACRAISKRAE